MVQILRSKRAIIVLASFLLSSAAHAQGTGPRLWIVDDGARTNSEVTLDGVVPVLDGSFPPALSARSSVDVDPNGTLWGASEKRTETPRGSVVNYGKDGSFIQVIPADLFGAFNVEGVAVDHSDGTLWVVDDPAPKNFPAEVPKVFHIARDGTLLGSVPVTDIDPAAASPQAIAYDPSDHTLWVTDNVTDEIYNIDKLGNLIASIDSRAFDARNPQGVTVDQSDGTLWFTDRTTGNIYNITKAGGLISSFNSTDYDAASLNPVGIAYDVISYWTQLANVIAGLQAIADALPAVPFPDDEKDLEDILDAIKHINKSFSTSRGMEYWQDSDTPRPRIRKGKKVFEKNRRAMQKLADVKNINGITDVSGAVDELLRITRELAEAAYDKATAATDAACALDPVGSPCIDATAKIAEADQLFIDADAEILAGNNAAAIDPKFRDAWIAAREAIQIAG